MTKTILVPIAEGTDAIEAICIIDTLRQSEAQVTVASVMQEVQVTISRGVRLVTDALLSECTGNTYDAIVLPGGLPGAEYLRDSKELTEMLKAQQQAGRIYAAICGAPAVVFQHHGLLKRKLATCHPALVEKLDKQEAVEQRVVVDGMCVTSRGPGTAIEFALKLIEILFDEEQAKKVSAPMLLKN